MKRALLAAALAGLLAADAGAAEDGLRRAARLLDEGRTEAAEEVLAPLVQKDPGNAAARRLLGDVYRRTHRYSKARAAYKEALRLSPGDREARSSLESLERRRGLALFGAAGDWEADSSGTSGWQVEAFHGGIDHLDPYVGYSYSDKYFYTRKSLYGRFYGFFAPNGYVKLSLGRKTYDYPVATNPIPDSNAYETVPRVEVEVADDLTASLRGSVAYEFYRPNFFFAPDDHASNHKLSGELAYQTSHHPLRLRLLTALLRDPDPAQTVVDRGARRVTTLTYGTQLLVGGGAELSLSALSGELLVIPNRDMDRSLSVSVLARVSVPLTERLSLTGHHVYDRYSDESPFRGERGRLFMLTAEWQATPHVRLSAGGKLVRRPVRDQSGVFVTALFQPGSL